MISPRLLSVFFTAAALGQNPSGENAAGYNRDNEQTVTIEKFSVTGTRFSLESIQYLSGLRAGQQVNEARVREACERITNSGLVENVSYGYESLSTPDRVALELKITDAFPLLPAAIRIQGVVSDDVWKALRATDSIFAPRLPRTEAALSLYAAEIQRYLKVLGREERLTAVVTSDPLGNANGIVFMPAGLRSLNELINPWNPVRKTSDRGRRSRF